jgi:ubiquinone/menaquinone biosynthesis C-methylase UbiE
MTRSADRSASEKTQRDYHNSISSEYDSHHFDPYAIEYRKQLFRSVLKDIQLTGMTVLDVAFGGATGLPDASFDLMMTESLHHTHPHLNNCATEIHRILKPCGYFFVWEPESGAILDKSRKPWYRLDPKYFQENEASIDFGRLIARHAARLRSIHTRYGGNLAHLLVRSSMDFRIPRQLIRYYAQPIMAIENLINLANSRLFRLWGTALLQKIGG